MANIELHENLANVSNSIQKFSSKSHENPFNLSTPSEGNNEGDIQQKVLKQNLERRSESDLDQKRQGMNIVEDIKEDIEDFIYEDDFEEEEANNASMGHGVAAENLQKIRIDIDDDKDKIPDLRKAVSQLSYNHPSSSKSRPDDRIIRGSSKSKSQQYKEGEIGSTTSILENQNQYNIEIMHEGESQIMQQSALKIIEGKETETPQNKENLNESSASAIPKEPKKEAAQKNPFKKRQAKTSN